MTAPSPDLDLDLEFEFEETQEESFAARRLKRAVVREELVAITGDFLEGLILGQMLYWTERVRHLSALVAEEAQRAELDAESRTATEPLKGWFTKTSKQLNEELMLGMSEPTIRTKLRSLVRKHLLLERENPYLKRDRAKQYRVSLLHLATILDQKGYHLEGYPKLGHLAPNQKILASNQKILASNQKILGTIYKINTKSKEDSLERESKGPDGPSHFLKDSLSQDGGWEVVSQLKEESLHSSTMTDRIKEKTTQKKSNDAKRRETKWQLPLQEQMPQSMRIWYGLPLVSKPKTARVYERNLSFLSKLSIGQFPTDYKNLNSDWTHQKGQPEITRKHLNRSWSDEEIAHLLDIKFRRVLTDVACWPQNKEKYFKGLSFGSFLFNQYSGRSWLLDLEYRQPQLEKSLATRRTLEHDPHPDCTYEIAEALEISKKLQPDEYAGIARNFSKLIQFFQLLPPDEESGGLFRFAHHPERIAASIADFLRQEYGWVRDPGAGLLSLTGKPIRKWLEEWNGQEIRLPGRKKPNCVWDLLDEYNQHRKLRATSESNEVSAEVQHTECQEDVELVAPRWAEIELKQREEEAGKHLAPEDILREDGQKSEKGRMWPKIKAALQRLKQGIPDPIVDESYAGF